MRLVVPDNNKDDIVNAMDRLSSRRSTHRLSGIYGKSTINRHIGSGRANLSHLQTRTDAEQRARKFQELGLAYEYSLNDVLPSARELKNRSAVIEELEWLEQSSFSLATAANYELMRLMARYCPSIAVSVSFFMGVDNITRLNQLLMLPNVRVINTDRSTYRNLPLLERMVKRAAEHRVGIRVIANLGCMSDCIRTEEHAMIKSMASKDRLGLHYAPCTFYCMRYLLKYPEKFLQLSIIRPEDLARYDDIGIDSVKLVDRTQTTSWIKRVVEHYLDGEFAGNILDLTCNFTTFELPSITNEEVEQMDMDKVIEDADKVMEYRHLLPMLMGVVIRPDFDFLSCDGGCTSCGECLDISHVSFDSQRRKIVLSQLDMLEKQYLFR
jgi:collagenase-like PrtC family protease